VVEPLLDFVAVLERDLDVLDIWDVSDRPNATEEEENAKDDEDDEDDGNDGNDSNALNVEPPVIEPLFIEAVGRNTLEPPPFNNPLCSSPSSPSSPPSPSSRFSPIGLLIFRPPPSAFPQLNKRPSPEIATL